MSGHLSDRRLKAYTTGSLMPREHAEVEGHLRACSACRNRMLDEGAPLPDEELFPKRLRLITGAAVGVLVVVAVAAMFWWIRNNMAGAGGSASRAAAQEAQSFRDGSGVITLTGDGRIEATFPIPSEYVKPMTDALLNQHLDMPQQVFDLSKGYPNIEVRKPGELRLLAPIGTAVLSDAPKLTWESASDVNTYTVTITRDGKTVAVSPPLIESQWQTPQLGREALYTWHVTAARSGDRIASSRPAGKDAAFYVLEENQARALDELARSHPTDHLLIAVAFAGAGALERAEDEMRIISRNNPRALLFREILANIRPGVDNR